MIAQVPIPFMATSWLSCRRGAVTIMLALATATLAVGGLFAVDVARLGLAQGRLQAATDAAALTATHDATSATLRADARQVFDANFPPGYLGTTVDGFDVRTQSDTTGLTNVSIDVSVSIPSVILGLGKAAGYGSKLLETHAAAERRVRSTELVMVLDNTGSMSGQKIKDLKTAARALSDAIFNGNEQVPGLYVGIVPYVATVNIGSQHQSWIVDFDGRKTPPFVWTDYAPSPAWKGCVMAQPSPYDQTDDPLTASGKLEPFFWASEDPNAPPPAPKDAPKNTWPRNGGVNETPDNDNKGYGPNLGCGPPITPLTASRGTVNAAIADLAAWNRGGTMANLGLVWGWRVLSPRWQGLWRHVDGTPVDPVRPLPYGTLYNSKVIVLMTDGENRWHANDLTAYGRLDDNTLGVTAPKTASAIIDQRMLNACASLKQQGIVLFTVTFGSGINQATRNRYTQCASSQSQDPLFPGQKYFNAPKGSDLENAFSNIAGQLTELRLVR